MAKETKVGLLAGLAFIICFAVILANRGRQEAVTQRLAFPADQGSGHGGLRRAARPGPVAGNPNTPGAPTPTGSGSGQLPVSRPEPSVGTPARPDGQLNPQPAGGTVPGSPLEDDSRFVRSASPTGDQAMAERVRLLEQRLAQMAGGTHDAPATTAAGVTPGQADSPASLTAQPVREGTRPAFDAARAPLGSPGSVERTAVPSVQGRRHVVAAGDSLTRIAERYYGAKSATYIRAIYDANRRVLADPDRLPIGVELVVPDLRESGASLAGGARSPNVNQTANTRETGRTPLVSESAGAFRWYQVKKDDRYVSIAREQLGSERRWKEIYELNKDKFPNASLIREGVRIKLPAAEVADARGGRR